MDRREFLKASIAGAGAWSAAPIFGRAQTRKYKTVLIGSGWWGMNIARSAMQSGECRLAALCDVDLAYLNPAAEEVEKLTGEKPRKYRDYREMLAAEKPDIAIVGTPDHWHALNTIHAIEAGAHVYVEKPVGHTIHEGRAMVNAARKHNRVVQVGTHRRASPHNISAMEFLRSGRLGKVGMVRAFVHGGGGAGKAEPDSDPPEGLDWNMWCGPAPLRPFNKRIHPRGFRGFLDYANGTLADWGIHWMDQILWWSEEQYPRRVFSTGGRHIRRDNTEAPDTQVASYEFESFTVVWEHRQYAANNAEKTAIGCYFYGTEGTLHLGWRDGWTFYPADSKKPSIHEPPRLNQPDDQNINELWADFLAAIRKGSRPVSDIEAGHRATNMSLLGMISLKVGRSIEWNGKKEVIVGDAEASKLLSRPYRAPWVYPSV
jgi:predicted dehydrogenase